MSLHNQITALILSGGAGSRFGRQDKGLTLWHDKPLIQHCIESLTPQVADILINCNRHHEQYKQFGHPLCEDIRPPFQGPLAGIEAGLTHCKTPFVLIYPCDGARAPSDLVSQLSEIVFDGKADIAYLNRSDRPQYLMAVIRQDLLASVSNFLDNGGRAVRKWYKQHHALAIDCDYTANDIVNFNTPSDLT